MAEKWLKSVIHGNCQVARAYFSKPCQDLLP